MQFGFTVNQCPVPLMAALLMVTVWAWSESHGPFGRGQ
jgi:hypothetical protein